MTQSSTAFVQKIALELDTKEYQVANVVKLIFEEDCTIPFVARYRKEMTGSMDEVKIRDIRERYQYLTDMELTRSKYLKSLESMAEQKPELAAKLPELKAKFLACTTKQELEDLYLPYKPKRRTRAQIAKEKGLEPLADLIWNTGKEISDLSVYVEKWIAEISAKTPDALQVSKVEEALQGAGDIISERLSEDAELRALVRKISFETAYLVSKKIETKAAEEDSADEPLMATPAKGQRGHKKNDSLKYQNYFDYREGLNAVPGHRIMAIRRGDAEKVLRMSIEVDEAQIGTTLQENVFSSNIFSASVKEWLTHIIQDSYTRLIGPSIETELRMYLKTRGEDEAIKVFAKNLQNLLLLPPIPGKVVLGVDPGLRTGSKLAVVSNTGKLLAWKTIYPDYNKEFGESNREAREDILKLIKEHNVEYISIGNGTGSREIDRFIFLLLKEHGLTGIKKLTVNEAGASVYSTDDVAREEFPDLDPTIRSAVSIARRLQDPLAELVKIDPRSIGVGQYQHDVNVTKLNNTLSDVVETCVNRVGVNLNTASYKLLSYVSGIGLATAKNVVTFRDQNGQFNARDLLLNIPGFSKKAFEQAAGFLRVPESVNPLDNSSIHPERYSVIEKIAADLQQDLSGLIGSKDKISTIPWDKYVSDTLGMPTLLDIASELEKPGRDPREDGARLIFSDEVSEITDLRVGMKLKGTVTNVTNFGAFVDIGVHQDGLVHISELSKEFVKDASAAVAVGDTLDVWVLAVDVMRRRISLTCKGEPNPEQIRLAAASPVERKQFRDQGDQSQGQRRPQGSRPQQQQRQNYNQNSQGQNYNRGRQQNGEQNGRRSDAELQASYVSQNSDKNTDRNSNRQQNQQPRHNNQGKRMPPPNKAPQPSFTMDDLLSKFNKR